MIDVVSDAYSRRAAEYTELFGSMSAAHPSDRQLVATWAGGIDGQVIDAGCGPSQWTNFLNELGFRVRGVDLVPEFIERAAAHILTFLSMSAASTNSMSTQARSVECSLGTHSFTTSPPRSAFP